MVVAINRYIADLYKLRNSRFIKDVTVMAGGTATAQLITIIFSPVITRLYGPDAFGILGVFIAVVAMIVPISNFAYANAIVIPASDSDAKALVRLSFLITVCIFFIILLVVAVFHNQIAHMMGFGTVSLYLLLVPPVVFISSCEHIFKEWLVRKKQFKPISGIAIAHTATTNVAKSGVGFFIASGPVLIILNTIGQFFHVMLLWMAAVPTLTKHKLINFRKLFSQISELKKVAFDYSDFPLFSSTQNIIYSFSENLPTIMLAAFFGPVFAGFYALSKRVLTLPFTLVSRSIGTVFLPRIAEAANRGEKLQPQLIKATAYLALLGLLPFGVVIITGPWLFSLVFGSEWVVAGEYARWLAVLIYFQFINVPCIQAIPVLGLQGYKLVYEILSTTVYAGTIAYGAFILESDILAIALFSVGGAVLYLGLILWVVSLSKTRTRKGNKYFDFIHKEKN